jgi:hypothetical protein
MRCRHRTHTAKIFRAISTNQGYSVDTASERGNGRQMIVGSPVPFESAALCSAAGSGLFGSGKTITVDVVGSSIGT